MPTKSHAFYVMIVVIRPRSLSILSITNALHAEDTILAFLSSLIAPLRLPHPPQQLPYRYWAIPPKNDSNWKKPPLHNITRNRSSAIFSHGRQTKRVPQLAQLVLFLYRLSKATAAHLYIHFQDKKAFFCFVLATNADKISARDAAAHKNLRMPSDCSRRLM